MHSRPAQIGTLVGSLGRAKDPRLVEDRPPAESKLVRNYLQAPAPAFS